MRTCGERFRSRLSVRASIISRISSWLAALAFGASLVGCELAPGDEGDELDQLGTVRTSIAGVRFRLWVADEAAERERGLMFVTPERLRPLPDGSARGMIFVYDDEAERSFWMKNTYVPLDIAYLDRDGVVVDVRTMLPLDERPGQYRSSRPATYAIEVTGATFRRIGLEVGARIDLWE